MDELELKARQEFSCLLTKCKRLVNTLLDDRPWGEVSADELYVEKFGTSYVRLDYEGMGVRASMHATDSPEFCRAITQVWNTRLRENNGFSYALIIRENPTEPTRAGQEPPGARHKGQEQ